MDITLLLKIPMSHLCEFGFEHTRGLGCNDVRTEGTIFTFEIKKEIMDGNLAIY